MAAINKLDVIGQQLITVSLSLLGMTWAVFSVV